MHGDEHLGGVCNLPEAGAGHFKDSKFRGASKAVFDAAENAISPAVFSLELQHNVYNVLQDLGARDGAFLCYMADKYYGDARAFGKP